MTKEEYLKKIKTKIKRTKVSVKSLYNGYDLTSKIKDLDIDIVKINEKEYFDITVKQIEICHKIYEVSHHFLYRPVYDMVEIRNSEYLDDGCYEIKYLLDINSYPMWRSHFRETIWCLSKALKNERIIRHGKE